MEFIVKENMELNYKIHCTSNQISIEDIIEKNKKIAEENEKIAEEKKRAKEDEEKRMAEEKARKEQEDREKQEKIDKNSALEKTFSKEYAKRAAVVSITNAYATDVYNDDRTTLNKSKFHSYSSNSGYFLRILNDGEWNVKNDNTWHVDKLVLKNTLGVMIDVSLDVSFDGQNYIISNISGKMGNSNTPEEQKTDVSEIEGGKSTEYLSVSPDLIKDDRESEKFKEVDKAKITVESKKVFEKYGKGKFPYGFKCHWIMELQNLEVSEEGVCHIKVGVTITNQYGAKLKANAEGTVKGNEVSDFYVNSRN